MFAAGDWLSAEDAARWGVAAPVVLGVYLSVGARLRKGYDKTRDTMSQLGDATDVAAFGFLVTNIAVGAMLFVFGWFAVEPHFGELVAGLVIAAAVGSVVIGFTAGDENCLIPGFPGRPRHWLHVVHLAVALLSIALMDLVPVVVLVDRWPPSGQFEVVNLVIAVAFSIVAVGCFVLSLLGRRQLRDRLLIADGKPPRPIDRPWSTPRVWLDRWGTGERILWAIGYLWVVAAATHILRPGWVAAAVISFFVVAMAAILRPPRVAPLVRFTVDSCQENTMYGTSLPLGELQLYRIEQPEAFATSLAELLDDGTIRAEHRRIGIQNGAPEPPHQAMVTIGFTKAGLDALNVPYRWTSERPDLFAEGMHARCDQLGDRAADWDHAWDDPHVAITVRASDGGQLAAARQRLARVRGLYRTGSIPLRTLRPNDGTLLLRFADGISQPWVHGVPDPRNPGRFWQRNQRAAGRISTWNRWQPLATGEFVLGQVDESNDVFPVPEPAELFVGATFAAIRQLEFQEARLGRLLNDLSRRGLTHLDALVKLVGRDPAGNPLVRGGTAGDNRFRFAGDPFGLTCPFTAHVRRCNPRDALGFQGLLTNRRRMIRRGVPYTDESGRVRGLLFVALQARLDDQFEFVQRQWLNDGGSFGLGRTPDAIAGHWVGPRDVLLPTGRNPAVATLEEGPITVARGGGYLVIPSIRALHYLARGVPAPGPEVSRPADRPAPRRGRAPILGRA